MPSASVRRSRCSVRSLLPVAVLLDFVVMTTLFIILACADDRGFLSSLWQQCVNYSFTQTVMDVVVIIWIKDVMMYFGVFYLEYLIKRETANPLATSSRTTGRAFVTLSNVFNLAAVAFAAAKLPAAEAEDDTYLHFPISLARAFLIIFIVSCAVSLLFSLWAVRYLRQLKETCGGYLAVFSAYEALDEADELGDETHSLLSAADEANKETDAAAKAHSASVSRVLQLAAPEIGILIPAFICLLASNVTNLAVPTFFGKVVDTVGLHQDKEAFRQNILTLLVIFAVTGVCQFLQSFLLQLAGQRILARLRMRVFSAIIHQDIQFFDLTHTGELNNRLASDTTVVQTVVTQNISMLTRNIVQIIGALFIMFYYSWRLTSVILSVVPVICIGAVIYGRQVRGLRKRFQDTLAKAAKTAEESISSVRTVRAFANEDKASDKYNEDITDSFGIGVKTALAAGGFFGAVSFLFQGAIVLVLWYGGTLVLDGHMTTGLLTTFMLYTLTTAMAIGVLSSVYGDLMQAVGASDRLFKLLDTRPQIEPDFDPTQSPQTKRKRTSSSVVTSYGALRTPSQRATATAAQNLHSQSAQSHAHTTQPSYGDVEAPAPSSGSVSTALRSARPAPAPAPAPATKTLGQGWGQISVPVMTSTRQQPHARIRGHIEFRDVSFAYPSRSDVMVIDDVSLTVAQGSVVALVGPSGGGKSTIISLLERFYDPVQGQVLVDGVDIRTHHPHEYRRQLALVGQEPVLFATTINENIAYGVEGATQEEVIQAAMKANAHDFIMTFPEGYDTSVGERGVKLSGGQKQRIAIARALLLDPAVLLLDEATSALDAESEHLVQEAIDRMLEGRTVLVVAHRLSTIRNADQVFVIAGGGVAERGTHDELIAKDGIYKNLVKRQINAGGEAVLDT